MGFPKGSMPSCSFLTTKETNAPERETMIRMYISVLSKRLQHLATGPKTFCVSSQSVIEEF